ncbi:VOC family protein [Streptomyces sp. SID11385]|uniref:VOC family protein n=1 Tax=Streptomyces sp. SID11385 TaxID=2706031 RepID=UPI0013C99266|nr:VOC family protein [Streptomyces sp. SID11385]NEA42506.1 VOC family protein [Streptomyces sp. SID11385]
MSAHGPLLVHHLGVFVTDFAAAERFWTAALAPLGIVPGYRADGLAEYWHDGHDTPSLALQHVTDPAAETRGLHLAFAAGNRAEVDAFHHAALTHGGTDRYAPRHWAEYRAYCAFVSDPVGNNVEALVKEGRG